jgi:hyperosmotically inducible periplasmic protein
MRILRLIILTLLVQSFPGSGSLNAGQEMQTQKSAPATNAFLVREVRHELLLVPWYTVFDNLQYSVSGNEVTLSGQVVQPTVKSDAENAVKHIEGVEKVNNEIEVLPASQLDDQLRRVEYHAIYSQANLSRYSEGAMQAIHIIVKDGHVTLEGVVDSVQDKDAANIYASTVPNVFSVENHLIVAGAK